MSRNLTLTAKQAIYAPQTSQVFLSLLEINHPDLLSPLRFVNNSKDVTSRSNVYLAYPFLIDLPEESAERISQVTLQIDNVDRAIVQAIRPLTSKPTIALEEILASSPDTVEAGPFLFSLENVRYNALVIEGNLAFEDILNESFPGESFTPATHPGLF